MGERPVVVEVIATAALQVWVPIDRGDDLEEGVEDVLRGVDGVRHAVVEELGDVTAGNDRLRVEVYAQLTFHLGPDAGDGAGEAARERLAASDAVASTMTFEIQSGPYRIEAW